MKAENTPITSEEVLQAAISLSEKGTDGLCGTFVASVLQACHGEYLLYGFDFEENEQALFAYGEDQNKIMTVGMGRRGQIIITAQESGFILGEQAEGRYQVIGKNGIITVPVQDEIGVIDLLYADASTLAFLDSFNSESMLIYNLTDEEWVYRRNIHKPISAGSTIKLLTAVLCIDKIADPDNTFASIHPDTLEKMSSLKAMVTPFSDEPEVMRSATEYLYAMLLPSGCDAAITLADLVSNRDPKLFADMMNEKAGELGCKNTKCIDSSGLDAAYHTTAYDLLKIFRYAIGIPTLFDILSTSFIAFDSLPDSLMTTNWMINSKYGNSRFFPYAVGGKTGTSLDEHFHFVCLYERADKRFIQIHLGSEFWMKRYSQVYRDNQKCMQYAFEQSGTFMRFAFTEHYYEVPIGTAIQLHILLFYQQGDGSPQWRFSSSDLSIATVSEEGIVEVHSTGVVQIYAISDTGDFDYCMINSTGHPVVTVKRAALSDHL